MKKPTEAVAPTLPSKTADDSSPPTLSKRKQRSAQRLLEFQQKKRNALLQHYAGRPDIVERLERKRLESRAKKKVRAKLRSLLWRAWAQWRPIFGGTALYYTSLREQYVYKRASKLYYAAFKSDPGKSGRPLAAWLRRATPMETETASSVAGSVGSQPSKRAKKSHGGRARAPPVAYCSGTGRERGRGPDRAPLVASGGAQRACVLVVRERPVARALQELPFS